ncbi:MAG: excinuclease ABC subunit UvrA [Symbiobacteriaceae bacterium]|nr:excinuclease ABC subunit UvrA [Symbiobacteriaceae bacterium]
MMSGHSGSPNLSSPLRTSIEVIGAKENNLKDITVEIPRDKITVITGVSGSGKSSLAFDTIYGEAQRRFLDSVSNFAKRRIGQVKKPNVTYVRGLSPVIAIEQKKANHNPRSTVGTVTDINDYLRLLFATVGVGSCPLCGAELHAVNASQLGEYICSLPPGTTVDLLSSAERVYGEDYDFLLEKIRKKGYKRLLINDQPYDLADKDETLDENIDYHIEIVLESFQASGAIYMQVVKSIEAIMSTLEDDIYLRLKITANRDSDSASTRGSQPNSRRDKDNNFTHFGCPEHLYLLLETNAHHFSFNVPASACETCLGVGTSHTVEPSFLVVNPEKSIMKGALHSVLFNTSSQSSYRFVIAYSLAQKYNFSLDTPFHLYSEEIRDLLFYGTKGETLPMVQPPFVEKRNWLVGRDRAFRGYVNDLERWYRNYLRHSGNADTHEPTFVKSLMIEKTCPACGGARLKSSRLKVTIGGKNIYELCCLQFPELIDFLHQQTFPAKQKVIAESIIREVTTRLQLLVDIGLDYLSLGRRSDSISGGEMQRIKMSTQISSELMGMLYVMDEPTIGLHPRDSARAINILRKLRDIGNTVIVVEHDLDTIRSADYLIEVGPGAGIHGGEIIACGSPEEFTAAPHCLTGAYLRGAKQIPLPTVRRKVGDACITLQGAKENNLKDITLDIPLGLFVCITGVSGSGKSTLVFETLAKNLEVLQRQARIVPGQLDFIFGYEEISHVVIIDQSPIGRNSKSNPATYVGIYDRIRHLLANTAEAVARGYTPLDFSLTHANGTRCEHCSGDGIIVTNLQFMADIETVCPVCKGNRFSAEGMEISYNGKNIAEVLQMTVEEALIFFADQRLIKHKLGIMQELGLGYMTLGQSATTLSGGEAQRIKLSYELGKIKRGSHNLYILDEPTTGLHCADIENLLASLQKLVDQGHSVIVVEHNLDVIKSADYLIDLGPEGGKNGGYVVATGTPEEVAQVAHSYTGKYLQQVLGS